MPHRLTKIYTKKGDKGYTSIAGHRHSKDDLLLEVIGTLDELNASIGLIVSHNIENKDIQAVLDDIQNTLFDLGGEFHAPDHLKLGAEKTMQLEKQLDEWNAALPPLKEFVLPGGNHLSAACHLARTICRRTERNMVRLHRKISLNNPEMLRYINRLSDLLFVLSRVFAKQTSDTEKMWQKDR